jgi:Predicted integral membrane protein (DUF2269)
MTLYSLAVFLHVVGDAGVFVAVGVTLYGLAALRQTARVEQSRPIIALMLHAERIYALAGPLLLLSGVYLTFIAWPWTTGWIAVALGSLVLLFPFGPILVSPRLAAIGRAAQAAADGPLPADLLARIHNPLLGIVQQGVAGVLLGIVFLMTVKPGLAGSLLVIACGLVLGVISALPLLRHRARLRGAS